MKAHCLFEQSGTFKNEFIKLGVEAEDYDILNDFNQTDHLIDLYEEIEKAHGGGLSIFDKINEDDIIMAFFPCIRFEAQILLWFRGDAMQQKNWSDDKKLDYDLELHKELSRNYELITKLALVCIKKGLKLIIENPYTEQHYLTRYWGIKPKVIDTNRRDSGDYMKKPTQYWFINCEPKNNFIFEPQVVREKRTSNGLFGSKDCQVMRSMISPEYANRFIREYILKDEL